MKRKLIGLVLVVLNYQTTQSNKLRAMSSSESSSSSSFFSSTLAVAFGAAPESAATGAATTANLLGSCNFAQAISQIHKQNEILQNIMNSEYQPSRIPSLCLPVGRNTLKLLQHSEHFCIH